MKGFAKGIDSDFEAVNQTVVSIINNGQVEGLVNRLKTIKSKNVWKGRIPLIKKNGARKFRIIYSPKVTKNPISP